MAVVIVTGIPGVGSSTVLREAFKLDESLSKEFVVVNYGDVMLEVARGKNLVEHRDQLRKLPDETRQRDVEREKEIEEHQNMNRAAAMAYAALTGACVKIIENHDGAVEEAAKEFLELLRFVKD